MMSPMLVMLAVAVVVVVVVAKVVCPDVQEQAVAKSPASVLVVQVSGSLFTTQAKHENGYVYFMYNNALIWIRSGILLELLLVNNKKK